ncbi:hypothetical protein [Polyangium sp. 15x6]|uniref:hypothetical protein n=1 Tax=Polyangium sp. 15x6 TaxID=3042687 RepID=UPI00249C696D|nr:hypothetical protein [Polyangium sp. 15x6]MDI3288745.1 hypothetical protein [Polyangium sp. 15x6]
MTRTLVASLLATFVAGCGFIKVGGLPSVSSGEPSEASGEAGAAGPKSTDEELLKLYQSIDYTCCTQTRASGMGFFQKAGVDQTGLFKRGNVDPEWIPGWSNDLSTIELTNALAQGAVNRTWQKQCFADYEDYRKGFAAIEGKHRPRFEALRKQGNYYEQASGLSALLSDVAKEAEQKGLKLPGSHPMTWVGLPYEIVTALFQVHRDTGHEYALADYVKPVGDQVEKFSRFGRPWSEDKTFDRDVFCAYAEVNGTHRTPKLPDIGGWEPGRDAPVRWPVAAERHAEVEKKLQSLQPQSAAALTIQGWKVPRLEMGTLDREPKAPKLFYTGPYTITSVQREGDKVVIGGEQRKTEPFNYDCRSTGVIESYDLNNNPVYGRNCKVGSKTSIRIAEVTFPDLPASIQLGKGDEISFYGDLVREEKDKSVKQTPSEVVTSRAHAFEGKHLVQVKREGKVLHSF